MKIGTGPKKHFHRMPDGRIGCWIAKFADENGMLAEPEAHLASQWEDFAPHGSLLVSTAYCDEHMHDPAKDPSGATSARPIRQ